MGFGTLKTEKRDQGIDVVYPLGDGSHWGNNELRYSLRSVAMNLRGYKRIIIAGNGRQPGWLKDALWLNVGDIFDPNLNADGNIINKVLAVIHGVDDLTQRFLFINDDHILLRRQGACSMPLYYKGCLIRNHEATKHMGVWLGRAYRTGERLRKEGKATVHYDCHTPIVMDKDIFQDVMARYDWQEGIGYVMKSLYANNVANGEIVPCQQAKVLFKNKMYGYADIMRMCQGMKLMSYQDTSLNTWLKYYLWQLFPEPCRYEADHYEPDSLVLVAAGIDSGLLDYDEMARLYIEHGRNKNLKRLFKMCLGRDGLSDELKQKLVYEVRKLMMI